ncbi:MAG: hypothetical protein LBL58_08675 [Tannerellaceae bacterium]|jgi:hypothetical protein|nr:hypothetical protein [Tannerellaceae bacterium]
MGNNEKIDSLLTDIKELETLITSMQEAEVYPVSFFNQTFDLTHKVLSDLHELERIQIEMLHKQMEEHRALINKEDILIQELSIAEATQPSGIIEKHTVSLHEALEKQNLSDLKKAFNLNDCFYFRRELFNGDAAKMNKVISDLNGIRTYEESVAYLNEKLNWNMEDTIVGEFIKLLERRFL